MNSDRSRPRGARGRFITLEGSEGAGKSSQMHRVVQWVKDQGHEVVETREPGGTSLGETLRSVLLNPSHVGLSANTEVLLMFAARAQHLHEVIYPALERGIWVVCDRFTDATYAYQGGGRELGFERIAKMEQWVQGTLRPDFCVLLDLPVATGLDRARARGPADRFERESESFFERVRASYLRRARGEPTRYAIIDAAEDEETVASCVKAALERWVALA